MTQEITMHRAALNALCHRHGVYRLDLFETEPVSPKRHVPNLDFFVEFKLLPAGSHSATYFGLLEGMEALFGRPVNLVVETTNTVRSLAAVAGLMRTTLYAV